MTASRFAVSCYCHPGGGSRECPKNGAAWGQDGGSDSETSQPETGETVTSLAPRVASLEVNTPLFLPSGWKGRGHPTHGGIVLELQHGAPQPKGLRPHSVAVISGECIMKRVQGCALLSIHFHLGPNAVFCLEAHLDATVESPAVDGCLVHTAALDCLRAQS